MFVAGCLRSDGLRSPVSAPSRDLLRPPRRPRRRRFRGCSSPLTRSPSARGWSSPVSSNRSPPSSSPLASRASPLACRPSPLSEAAAGRRTGRVSSLRCRGGARSLSESGANSSDARGSRSAGESARSPPRRRPRPPRRPRRLRPRPSSSAFPPSESERAGWRGSWSPSSVRGAPSASGRSGRCSVESSNERPLSRSARRSVRRSSARAGGSGRRSGRGAGVAGRGESPPPATPSSAASESQSGMGAAGAGAGPGRRTELWGRLPDVGAGRLGGVSGAGWVGLAPSVSARESQGSGPAGSDMTSFDRGA